MIEKTTKINREQRRYLCRSFFPENATITGIMPFSATLLRNEMEPSFVILRQCSFRSNSVERHRYDCNSFSEKLRYSALSRSKSTLGGVTMRLESCTINIEESEIGLLINRTFSVQKI